MCAVSQGPTLDLHANYNTVGVNVKLATPDPEKDATAILEYGPAPDKLTRGVPLSRVDNEFGRLSGCVFWCEPNTTYHVRVTLQDPTTKAIHGIKLIARYYKGSGPSRERMPSTELGGFSVVVTSDFCGSADMERVRPSLAAVGGNCQHLPYSTWKRGERVVATRPACWHCQRGGR